MGARQALELVVEGLRVAAGEVGRPPHAETPQVGGDGGATPGMRCSGSLWRGRDMAGVYSVPGTAETPPVSGGGALGAPAESLGHLLEPLL